MKPAFWDQACAELSAADAALGAVIDLCGPVHLTSRGDAFQTLARSIVGQQISVKAAQSVWNRLVAAVGDVLPQRLAAAQPEALRAAGLSGRKVEYVQDLARRFAAGLVDPQRWPQLDDEAVIAELSAVRGIGRWTAEMVLIFNLQRPDVFPVDDLGLLRGIEQVYGLGERVTRKEALLIGQAWQPWRTVATWYLWRSLDPVPVEY